MDEIEMFASAPFKCLSCRMIFESSEEHRTHYKTEFHRFNVKRKTVGLPPIPQETFDKKINEIKIKEQEAEVKQTSTCTICNKHYASQNAYNQHIQSKKHLEAVNNANNPNAINRKSNKPVNATQIALQQEKEKSQSKASKPTQTPSTKEESQDDVEKLSNKVEEVTVSEPTEQSSESQPSESTESSSESKPSESTEGEEEEKPKTPEEILEEKFKSGAAIKMELTDCLFCKQTSPDLKQNLKHMTKEHGLFIPDIEYLIDLAGLIAYLGEKVGIGNTCLYCNKTFSSVVGVRNHMNSLNHCKLLYDDEGQAELDDFYDFSSSYKDIKFDEADTKDEDAESRTIENFSRRAAARLTDDGYGLVLKDGRTLGHRSLTTFYKQKMKPPTLDESIGIIDKMVSKYKALGWTTSESQFPSGVDRSIQRANRRNNAQQARLGVKGNKLFLWRRQIGF